MKIFLRPVTLDDGPQIVKWRNHKDVSNHCMNRNAISIESNRLFFEAYVATGKYKQTRPISDGFRKNNVNYWAFREIRSIIPHL